MLWLSLFTLLRAQDDLDTLLDDRGAGANGEAVVAAADPHAATVAAAQAWRKATLTTAIDRLESLRGRVFGDEAIPSDDPTAVAVKRWMYTTKVDLATMTIVEPAIDNLKKNLKATATVHAAPVPRVLTCPHGDDDWACTAGTTVQLNPKLLAPAARKDCQNAVLGHEYFHVIGLADPPTDKPYDKDATFAQNDPGHLIGLACEVALGRTDTSVCDVPCD